jgi:hypothetical protein
MELTKDREVVDAPLKSIKHTGPLRFGFNRYIIGQKYITLCGIEDIVVNIYPAYEVNPISCEECLMKSKSKPSIYV